MSKRSPPPRSAITGSWSVGLNEASEVADTYVKENSLTALYDSVLIPVITAVETDHQRAALDNEQRDSVEQGIRDIVEDFSTRPPSESQLPADQMVAEHSPPPVSAQGLARLLPAGASGTR